MRSPLMTFITRLGEASRAVQERRQLRQDWRTQEWHERFDVRDWGHVTGEVPLVHPQS